MRARVPTNEIFFYIFLFGRCGGKVLKQTVDFSLTTFIKQTFSFAGDFLSASFLQPMQLCNVYITFNCITTFVFHIFHAYFAHFIFHSARTVAIEVTVIALRLFKVDNIVDCHKITLNISACVRTELNFVITERGL